MTITTVHHFPREPVLGIEQWTFDRTPKTAFIMVLEQLLQEGKTLYTVAHQCEAKSKHVGLPQETCSVCYGTNDFELEKNGIVRITVGHDYDLGGFEDKIRVYGDPVLIRRHSRLFDDIEFHNGLAIGRVVLLEGIKPKLTRNLKVVADKKFYERFASMMRDA